MKIVQEHQILHIIYKDIHEIPKYIIDICNAYEGEMKQRVGFNFPMSFVKKTQPKSELLKYNTEYVIVYKKGDISTKKHELQHAKFYMDTDYKKQVHDLWNSFTDSYQKQIILQLKKMHYPDNMDILMDEFQAYYFTEKSNFFGVR